jgi:hypothetical protein
VATYTFPSNGSYTADLDAQWIKKFPSSSPSSLEHVFGSEPFRIFSKTGNLLEIVRVSAQGQSARHRVTIHSTTQQGTYVDRDPNHEWD